MAFSSTRLSSRSGVSGGSSRPGIGAKPHDDVHVCALRADELLRFSFAPLKLGEHLLLATAAAPRVAFDLPVAAALLRRVQVDRDVEAGASQLGVQRQQALDDFHSNPGLSSRIAHHIDFPNYDLDELAAFGELMVGGQRYELSNRARATFRFYLSRRLEQPRFANARSVRNAVERARLRHTTRLVDGDAPTLTEADLELLKRPTSWPAGYSPTPSPMAANSRRPLP